MQMSFASNDKELTNDTAGRGFQVVSAGKQVYRADRRNAARKAGTLNQWRFKRRIRTSIFGVRSEEYVVGINPDGTKIIKTRTWRVYTEVVAA